MQSAGGAAGDQGELVSRIKSLELENQTLNKGQRGMFQWVNYS